jgi:hypothetical protein
MNSFLYNISSVLALHIAVILLLEVEQQSMKQTIKSAQHF